jgi:hypothetical protein
MNQISSFEIWAQIFLSSIDRKKIREFFVKVIGINPEYIIQSMHLTYYHTQVPIKEVIPMRKNIHLVLPAIDTRFMVMVPGGENPRPDIDPEMKKVGIRIHRASSVLDEIIDLRNDLSKYETREVLGDRSPSSRKKSAFGSRYFQPHIALLEPGSGINRDLTIVGKLFREQIGDLTFDRLIIDVVQKEINSL